MQCGAPGTALNAVSSAHNHVLAHRKQHQVCAGCQCAHDQDHVLMLAPVFCYREAAEKTAREAAEYEAKQAAAAAARKAAEKAAAQRTVETLKQQVGTAAA